MKNIKLGKKTSTKKQEKLNIPQCLHFCFRTLWYSIVVSVLLIILKGKCRDLEQLKNNLGSSFNTGRQVFLVEISAIFYFLQTIIVITKS